MDHIAGDMPKYSINAEREEEQVPREDEEKWYY